ncbi:hypothetical protein CFOL_v3_33766 [Cephalotus follicularis]|uniref:Uncharacterized protein n=1 Tax=Cephalotus follicularis TaxID=3775 RepID=A0A1Q3DD09_CEPFO|nr:hypothetical protein CFOL_v3_33766 [Cephalotus follicularis]
MNCIQKGLIPTKYFEKRKQKLSTTNGENLKIEFKVTNVYICDEGIYIKQPFLEIIKPFKIKTEGITTKMFEQKIIFALNEKPISKNINLLKIFSLFKEHSVNLIKTKENHLYFMKKEVSNKKLEQHLQIREKINSLKNNIINNLCPDLPDAFWHRKQHMVSLPYEKEFTEQNIPTKARPIQMTYELIEHCKKEIQELLNKKLIRPSKSLWNCAIFYVNQGVQRSIINYKTLKIRFYTPFKRYEWNVILSSSQNTPRKIQKIMNDFFNQFSSFPIEYVNNSIVLTNKLVLPRTKLYLFILHNHYMPIQRSILFTKKFSNVIVNKKNYQFHI